MHTRLQIIGSLILLLTNWTFAQGGPAPVGIGYASAIQRLAPGQIVRLQVAGLKTVLPCEGLSCSEASSPRFLQPTTTPLPTSLAGISVKINQYVAVGTHNPFSFTGSYKAPLVSIVQARSCFPSTATSPDCFITFITIQLPYDLQPNTIADPTHRSAHEIVIAENGVDGPSFGLDVVSDGIHVITTCDTHGGVGARGGCLAVVAHANGNLVSAASPAIPGETVVVYAWGLGGTVPNVKAGDLTTEPAPVWAPFGDTSRRFPVYYDLAVNAAPSWKPNTPFATAAVFLTPGQVGLYQINVRLPEGLVPTVPCGFGVDSNLTVSFILDWSQDGAGICVQPAGQ